MFDIIFTRNGDKKCTQVIAQIELDLDVEESVLCLKWECGTQYGAALLQSHLSEKYHKRIEEAHRQAYEQGYKDGRGRKRKKTWFSRCFQKNGICCS